MSDFFEQMYTGVGEDWERIPWVHLEPRPFLVDWLEAHPPAPDTRALVVACGLGDDAEELARRGCAVDAFDFSPTAIATARRRFPDSPVGYQVADLFELPEEWRERFEIVVEVQTVQSLPIERHRAAIGIIAACVAPGGHLLVRCAVRGEDEPAERMPWPLKWSELAWFEEEGLEQVGAEPDGTFFHIYYRR